MRVDWINIIEAAYRVDQDQDSWLAGVLDACRPALDRGAGIAGMLYDASTRNELVPLRFMSVGGPEGISPALCVQQIEQGDLDAQFVERTFGRLQCDLVSRTFGLRFPEVLAHLKQLGIKDMLAVNGTDPTLMGCFLTGNIPRRPVLTDGLHMSWSRIAAHLAAGYRLQRRLGDNDAGDEAVITPGGRTEHAEGIAKAREARENLRDAVITLERVRGRMRKREPEEALRRWRALVDARWSLVDQFDSDGRRYVIAKRNEAAGTQPRQLSPRERQVLAYASLGHSNKVIAYELGLSASTVRVLLTRASRKLGVKGRQLVLDRFRLAPPPRS
jgi:DNA-binding CsgD family transcriptional regulator